MTMTPSAPGPCRSLWCEETGHSFSERDPGWKLVTIEGTDDTGAPVNDSRTVCGACAPKVHVRRSRPAEIPGQAPLPLPTPAAWPSGYEPPAPDPAAAWSPASTPDGAPRL